MAMKKLKQDDHDSYGLAKQVQAALEHDRQRVLIVNSSWLFDFASCGECSSDKLFEP